MLLVGKVDQHALADDESMRLNEIFDRRRQCLVNAKQDLVEKRERERERERDYKNSLYS